MKKPSTSFSLASRSASVQGGNVGKAAGGGLRCAFPPFPSSPAFPSPKSDPWPASRSWLEQLGLGQRRLQRLDQLLAVAAERVAGAGRHQRLEHPLVAEPEVDPLHQFGQRACSGPAAARR